VELAQHSIKHRWTAFPEILDPAEVGHPILSIVDGHSPRVLEEVKKKGHESIANSIELGVDSKRHAIITGPNAQGKSTALRMAGQLLTLAQMGLPVPAQFMKFTPLGLIVYLHPKDNPALGDSLFMAEARELWQGVYRRAARNPFQLIIMDEIAPGTTWQVREDFESVFLQALDQTGILSLTATHNFGTIELGQNAAGPFINLHVDNYHVRQGHNTDLGPMYAGAAKALRDVGVPEGLIERFLQLGSRRRR
jgi:DNA mismatch repair ATPase MutS